MQQHHVGGVLHLDVGHGQLRRPDRDRPHHRHGNTDTIFGYIGAPFAWHGGGGIASTPSTTRRTGVVRRAPRRRAPAACGSSFNTLRRRRRRMSAGQRPPTVAPRVRHVDARLRRVHRRHLLHRLLVDSGVPERRQFAVVLAHVRAVHRSGTRRTARRSTGACTPRAASARRRTRTPARSPTVHLRRLPRVQRRDGRELEEADLRDELSLSLEPRGEPHCPFYDSCVNQVDDKGANASPCYEWASDAGTERATSLAPAARRPSRPSATTSRRAR